MVNNRKVNKGKKLAIEAGREALKSVHPQRAGETNSDLGSYGHNDEDDAEGEEDDDYSRFAHNLHSSISPSVGQAAFSNKRVASNGPNYRGSTPKKAKRPSKYQLNEQGEIVEVSDDGVTNRIRRISQAMPQQQTSNRSSSHGHQAGLAGELAYSGADFESDYNADGEHTVHHTQGVFPRQGGIPGHGAVHGQGSFRYSVFQGPRLGSAQHHR